MSEHIKKVNWPWVEIEDMYAREEGDTVTINMNDVSLLWPRVSGQFHYGVNFKNGNWFEFISKEGIKELQELVQRQSRNS